MQMNANMGTVNAIQEMLLHTVRGTMRAFLATHKFWQHAVSFEKMRTESDFVVSAQVKEKSDNQYRDHQQEGGRTAVGQ